MASVIPKISILSHFGFHATRSMSSLGIDSVIPKLATDQGLFLFAPKYGDGSPGGPPRIEQVERFLRARVRKIARDSMIASDQEKRFKFLRCVKRNQIGVLCWRIR